MKKNIIILLTLILGLFVYSCKDFDEMNINPNGVDPKVADLNLLLPTIETSVGQTVLRLGFGDLGGVMQHTQYDGWSSGHNDYDWDNSGHNWAGYYSIIRNDADYYDKAVDGNFDFHKGVALVMKAYAFGLIADLWGDAPYKDALKAEFGSEYFKPKYDSQKDIYDWILADLDTANVLLSGSEYENVVQSQDVIYAGDASKWRKFANSLALRYYMRLQAKLPDVAEAGVKKIVNNPDKYPLILLAEDDTNISFIGSSPYDSWPCNTYFDKDPAGNYMRTKMCSTLVDTLQSLNDPRLGVWANKIEIRLKLVPGENIDKVVGDSVRYISQDVVDEYEEHWGVSLDFDPDYVGIPPSIFAAPQYNLNPNLEQGVYNPHCSQLNDIYKETAGNLLQMRLMSAAEVNFILAEAASYGWTSNAEGYFKDGIKQSMIAWGIGNKFDDYISGVTYNGLESIIQQKWIASWTAAAEAWFDYRRTGLPKLNTGESAMRDALPLRFYYNYKGEIALNPDNAKKAIEELEPTEFVGDDPTNNSAWSKTWLLQGTGKPY